MDALPTSGVWQSYRRMPVESDYVVRGVDNEGMIVMDCHYFSYYL